MNGQIEQYKNLYIKEICELIRIPSRSTPEGGEEAALQAVVQIVYKTILKWLDL